MNLKYLYVGLIFYLQYQMGQCKSNSITYISTERPAVYWYDTKYFKNFTLISKRWSRQDPRYYVELYVHPLFTVSNNLKLDFYFYQFLTNRYKPSFVEMHFKFCDMLLSDTIFGQAIRNALGGRAPANNRHSPECLLPPDVYDLQNMSISHVPKGFPFTKGRIYCNLSHTEGGVTRHVFRGSIDMEIKAGKIYN